MQEEVIAFLAAIQRTQLYLLSTLLPPRKEQTMAALIPFASDQPVNMETLQPPEHFLTFALGPPGP